MAQHLEAGRLAAGQRAPAAMSQGTPTQPLVRAAPPGHKQNSGTARERAGWARAQAQHRKHKRGRQTKAPGAPAQRYARTWVLFTTAATVDDAVTAYAGRMNIEETNRDWNTGWGVRAAAMALPGEAMVERLVGIVCLVYLLEMQLGRRVSTDPVGRRCRAQWTVTDRVSWFWCGQQLFRDPGYTWGPWLDQQWATLGAPRPAGQPCAVADPAVAQAA